MDKLVILTTEDNPAVLQAIARDLHKQYGDGFRILRSDSGCSALKATQKLKLHGTDPGILR